MQTSLQNEENRRALDAVRAEIEALCPQLPVGEERMVAHLIERLTSDFASLAEAVTKVRAAEICLAFHCAQKNVVAVKWLERTHLQPLAGWLTRQRIAPSLADEVAQVVRERLLSGERPKLLDYNGTGELSGFIHVIAMREALYLQKRGQREVPATDQLLDLLPQSGGLELEYMCDLYQEEFRQAFVEALAAITPRERNLLRQSHLRQLSIDRLGVLYEVHRATAARWVKQAEAQLLETTRRRLMSRLALEPMQIDSILRVLGSRIDLSVQRHLGMDDE